MLNSHGLNPGDEARPGEAQTAENACPDCGGSGRREGGACPTCGGSGLVTEIVGDA
jgi:DnaJ-class molecular chaperone